ncbi:hypothetical protein ACFVJS_11840 [Nocardioides sp. NPDC057772]|uniref:hypothetical protein n=1 Tax=Nocardioides sp. NPDC057772 TaxID=3346245 RepID=UPI00366C6B80
MKVPHIAMWSARKLRHGAGFAVGLLAGWWRRRPVLTGIVGGLVAVSLVTGSASAALVAASSESPAAKRLLAALGLATADVSDVEPEEYDRYANSDVDCTKVDPASPAADSAALAAEISAVCDVEVAIGERNTPWDTYYAVNQGSATKLVRTAAATRTKISGEWKPVEPGLVRVAGSDDLTLVSGVYDFRFDAGPIAPGATFASMTDPGVTDAGVSVGFELPVGLGVAKVEDVVSGAGESSVGSRVSWPVLDAAGSPIAGARLLASVERDAAGMVPVLRVDSLAAFKAVEAASAEAGSDQVAFEMTLKGAQWKPQADGSGPDGVAADGTLEAVNGEGEVVMVSPVARQWDAAGSEQVAAESGEPTTSSSEKSSAAEALEAESSGSGSGPDVSATKAVGDDRAGAPLAGDKVKLMHTKVAANGRSFTAAVDEAMVIDGQTSWPLHFDPAATNSRTEWTMIESALPSSSSGYKFSSDNGTGVGRCVYGVAAECNRTTTKRLIWEFGGLGEFVVLEPRELISASFSAWGTHSYSCTDKMVKSYRMADLTSSSTWNSHAGYFTSDREMGVKTLHHKSGCPKGPQWVEFDVLSGAKQKVEWNDDTFTIGLAVADTSSMAGWKRYRWDAKLEVEYNRAPNTPTSMSTDGRGCTTGSGRPLLNEGGPLLSALASDPDGDNSRVRFTLQKYSSGAWSTAWTSGYTSERGSTSAHTTSGLGMPSLGTATYRWRATAYDNVDIAKTRPGDVAFGSAASAWCEFGVDRTDPGAPTFDVLKLSDDPRAQAVYDDPDMDLGGVGQTGCFRIKRGANSSDVVKYEYKFSPQASVTTVSSTSTSIVVCWAPTVANSITLTASTYDKALNKSNPGTLKFTVATAREDGIWSFDDVSAPGRDVSVKDTGEQEPAGTLVLDGVDYSVQGPHGAFGARDDDFALGFAGIADEDVHTEAQVIDTKQSFVISVHVKLDASFNPNAWGTVLSQELGGNDGFRLGYLPNASTSTADCPAPGTGCWAFIVRDKNNASKLVYAKSAAKFGEWVHLTAEYDKGAATDADDRLRLWTCQIGTPDAPEDAEVFRSDATFTGPLALPRGKFYVGHGFYQGNPSDRINGVIDNIRIFKGDVLAEAKVRRMCQGAEAWQGQDEDKFLNPTQN